VGHQHLKLRRGDLLDRTLGVPPVPCLALVELREQALVELEGLAKVGSVGLAPALVDRGSPLPGEPVGVLVERVVVPWSTSPGSERRLEGGGDAMLESPVALASQGGGEEITEARRVVARR
jgi:hypothetical protein